MSGQIKLRVEMELLSDAIFGSGYSVPGGEDIAICQDDDGWPYLKGSTLKGLLRESLTNYLVWTGGDERDLTAILGNLRGGWNGDTDSEWNGADDGRKVHVTALTLSKEEKEKNQLNYPEQCVSVRAFTSLENGTVRAHTLRQALCVRRGLRFVGELSCAPQDTELLQKALMGVRWVGTMRSRGFGEIRLRGVPDDTPCKKCPPIANACCVRFRLHTDAPIFMTHLGDSQGNSYETRGYLSGAAIRGFVMGRLAASDSVWFAEHRRELLSDSVRFLDAFPIGEKIPIGEVVPAIPTPKCFYEDKTQETDGKKELFNVTTSDDDIPEGWKRARTGAFCRFDGDALKSWSAHSGGVTRIQRGDDETDKNMFSVRTLDAGQDFEGYFLTDNPALSEKISSCLTGEIWLGADRYAGFGQCTVTDLRAEEVPARMDAYGFRERDAVPHTLYLLALSPFSMLDDCGTPCGIDEARLAEQLGVGSVKVDAERSAASLTEFGGYNRTWGCRTACASLYERGSVFRIQCDRPPEVSALRRIELEGLGIRRAEGLGQVLFLRNHLFETIRCRVKTDSRSAGNSERSAARQAKYKWLTERVQELRKEMDRRKLSKSQLGTLQSLCEASLSRNGDWSELDRWLNNNLTQRGARHGNRFQYAAELARDVLETPLDTTLSEPSCADSMEERLRLLIQLFDFSRRGNPV